jgi:transcriptional regulator with XRE-family HTH domain
VEVCVVKPTVFTGLGQALRWLRERQTRKQYQVADLAGITKGMLSAYETGRQRPSLETLDKLLDTLGCDLNDLHNAIQIVNGRPEAIRKFAAGPDQPYPFRRPGSAAPDEVAEAPDAAALYQVLGRAVSRPEPEDRALSQMLDGFHRLIRYWDQALSRLRQPPPPGGSGSASPRD